MAQRVPGLQIRIENDTGIIAPPLFERYPTYVGVGDPYKLISDTALVRGSGTTDNIPTVTTVNEIVSIGDLPGIPKYVSGTDYSSVGNTVSWLPGGSAPTATSDYYITYTETRAASAYQPTLYLNENLIYEDHGFQTKTDGNPNDISIAGFLGINSGANGVIIAQLDPTSWVDAENPTNIELENAFTTMITELNKIVDYKLFLVGLSSGTLSTVSAATLLFNHAVLASQPARAQERTVIAAMPKATTYQGYASAAQAVAHERYVVPASPIGEVNVTGQTTIFDTRFHAAALAAKLCAVGIGDGISDEILPNITFNESFSPDELNYMVRRGVSPAKQQGDLVRNVMAITTDTTSALTEDLGVQDIKDYTKKYWRDGLYPVYRNKKINENLIAAMTESSEGILDKLIEDVVISEYRNISVTQDRTEPRQVNISAKIQPAYTTQWIDVVFTFVLSF